MPSMSRRMKVSPISRAVRLSVRMLSLPVIWALPRISMKGSVVVVRERLIFVVSELCIIKFSLMVICAWSEMLIDAS